MVDFVAKQFCQEANKWSDFVIELEATKTAAQHVGGVLARFVYKEASQENSTITIRPNSI